jgi:hypothetical protein
MAAADTIRLKRGEEITVRVTLKLRNQKTGDFSDPDISGATEIKWKILPDLNAGTAALLEKKLSNSGISVITDGTGGNEAVIEFTISESDSNLNPRNALYWQAFTLKSNVTRIYEPGRVIIEAAGDY